MPETLTFHFEGALADAHRMNFYESARFQYAAARLMVKLAQFRNRGVFGKKVTISNNIDIQLSAHENGSFNINIEDDGRVNQGDHFIQVSLGDLLAYVSEQVVGRINEEALTAPVFVNDERTRADREYVGVDASWTLDQLARSAMEDNALTARLPPEIQDLVRRRVAEVYREQQLTANQAAISRIDVEKSQKLLTMSAPLIADMSTALRKSADTLEVTSSTRGRSHPVLFLDRGMAKGIETARVDKDTTSLLGDITQFNKENGWGKIKIEDGSKLVSFNIPYSQLHDLKDELIDRMKRDLVYVLAYPVRDLLGDIVRLIVVGILPTPLD